MISVVITVRNRPGYLRECIKALLRQTIADDQFEIIIVDDASKDGTWRVAMEYRKKREYLHPNIRALKLGKRSGPGVARNIGNAMASNEIIVVQDSDDVSLRERLRMIHDYFKAHPHIQLFWSGANMVDRNLKHRSYHHARQADWNILERQQNIWHPTMAYRRSILKCAGGPIEYPADLADVDYGFLLDAKKSGIKPGHYDQPLLLYRSHPGQISQADKALQQQLANEKRAKQ